MSIILKAKRNPSNYELKTVGERFSSDSYNVKDFSKLNATLPKTKRLYEMPLGITYSFGKNRKEFLKEAQILYDIQNKTEEGLRFKPTLRSRILLVPKYKAIVKSRVRVNNHLIERQTRILYEQAITNRTPLPKIKTAGIIKSFVIATNIDYRVKIFVCGTCKNQELIIRTESKDQWCTCSSCKTSVLPIEFYGSNYKHEVQDIKLIAEYEDDKCFITFQEQRAYKLEFAKDQIVSYSIEHKKWVVFKNTGYVALRVNNKYYNFYKKPPTIPSVFIDQCKTVFNNLGIKFPTDTTQPSHSLAGTVFWKFARNPLWKDIGSYNISGIDEKFTRRLRYHHKKYGTKKARQMFYGTTSKALITLISSTYGAEAMYTLPLVRALYANGYNDAQILNAIKGYINKYDNQIGFSRIEGKYMAREDLIKQCDFFIKFLENSLGTKQKVINFLAVGTLKASTLRDSVKQISEILEIKPDYKLSINKDLDVIEFILSRDYRALVKNPVKATILIDNVSDVTTQDFMIKQCTHTTDLVDIGTRLNICVASYASMATHGKTHIFEVMRTGTEELLACVEVKPNRTIVQAKLAKNQRVITMPDLDQFLCEWAKEQDLTIVTGDLSKYEKMPLNTDGLGYNRMIEQRVILQREAMNAPIPLGRFPELREVAVQEEPFLNNYNLLQEVGAPF